MPDLTEELLPHLKANRIPDLDLGQGSLSPAYHGHSLLNVPASFCRWLGADPLPHPAVALAGLDELAAGAQQVIVCLVDSVGFHRFHRWLEGPCAPLLPYVEAGLLAPLTTVAPSTTSSALTTFWTGRSPAEHGILGFELLLREYGLVANMATQSPEAFLHQTGGLRMAGFAPELALPVPTLGPRLRQAGVEVHAYLPTALKHSGLSQLHFPAVEVHGFSSLLSLWGELRDLVERDPPTRRFVWIYEDSIDSLSHHAGPDSEEAANALGVLVSGLVSEFLASLSPAARRGVLFLFLADHGQIGTTVDPHYEVRSHPSLNRRLHLRPTGESRLAYLYIQPGQTEAISEYFQRTWPGGFQLLPSSLALEAGLFGPGEPSPEAPFRIGDRVALALGGSYLWWARKRNELLGQHGGLTADEMLVPFLAARLD